MGLRWEDVDLDARRLSIRTTRVMLGYAPHVSEPKTRRGRRMIALDPVTTAQLREHRAGRKRSAWPADRSGRTRATSSSKKTERPITPNG